MSTAASDFYVIGGTLRRDAPSYVKRQADDDLYNGLTTGQFCYVLTSRQMGKSSLMVRTAVRLRADEVSVAVLDLTALGQNVTAEQWYQGLLGMISEQLNLEDELEDFWTANRQIGPLQRWMRAIRDVVMTRKLGRIVIFVDEIDAVRSLPFSTDEFFAAIREFYNRRTEDADLERLTFCLLGVATPSGLIRDIRTTPFNIGRRIELQDFAAEEAQPLAQGLGREEKTAGVLLTRVLYWTEGHPYLTQRLCQALAEDLTVTSAAGVDRVCQELFLSARARERDDNLIFVRERVLRSEEADRITLLDLYLQIRKHRNVLDDEANPLVSILRLSGIARVVNGYLHVRNRIYYRAFDQKWVRANMPDAELQRQRRAYRTGQFRAAAIAAVIIAVLTGSVTLAAVRERNRAVEATHRADQNAEKANTANARLQEVLKQLQVALGDANKQRDIADQKSKQTEEQRGKADEQRKLAEVQRAEAENQRREAIRLRAVAESKSRQVEQQSAGDQANLLFLQGAYDKAEPLYRQYLDFLRVKYGSAHPGISKVLSSLAEIFITRGDYAKAEPLYKEALSNSQASLGPQHPDVVRIMESYAALLRKLDRNEVATELEDRVKSIRSSGLTGSFSGVVMNSQTNKPIDRAVVQFINKATGVPTATRTAGEGNFFKDRLLPGTYIIRISAPGFISIEVIQLLRAGKYSELPAPVKLDPHKAMPNRPDQVTKPIR